MHVGGTKERAAALPLPGACGGHFRPRLGTGRCFRQGQGLQLAP